MGDHGNYWQRRRLSRRNVLSAAAATGAGVAAFAVAGCGDDDDKPAATATSASSPASSPASGSPAASASAAPSLAAGAVKAGGNAAQSQRFVVKDFDPHRTFGALLGGFINVIEPAIELGPNFELVPRLVSSWETTPDGLNYTFKVAPDAKWQNKAPVSGRKVTAEDIAFNLNRIAGKLDSDKGQPRPRASGFSGFDKAEAIDPGTLRLKMTAPNGALMINIAHYSNLMVPKELIDQAATAFNDPAKIVGSGPFTVEKFEVGVEGVFKKNPDYWRKAASGAKLPYLDEMKVRWLADMAAEEAAFISGQTNVYRLENKQAIDNITKGKSDARVVKYAGSNGDELQFNTLKAVFKDPRVWKALHLATDYKDVNDAIYGPGLWVLRGPGVSTYPGALKPEDIAKQAGWNPATKDADRAEAKKLMAAAGFQDGGITFNIIGQGLGETISVNLQSQWKKVWPALKMEITPTIDVATFNSRRDKGEFDAQVSVISPEKEMITDLITHFATKGARNYGKYSNPQLDDLLNKAAAEVDTKKRGDMALEAQKLLIEGGMPTMWLNVQYAATAFQKNFGGMSEKDFGPGSPGAAVDALYYYDRFGFLA